MSIAMILSCPPTEQGGSGSKGQSGLSSSSGAFVGTLVMRMEGPTTVRRDDCAHG